MGLRCDGKWAALLVGLLVLGSVVVEVRGGFRGGDRRLSQEKNPVVVERKEKAGAKTGSTTAVAAAAAGGAGAESKPGAAAASESHVHDDGHGEEEGHEEHGEEEDHEEHDEDEGEGDEHDDHSHDEHGNHIESERGHDEHGDSERGNHDESESGHVHSSKEEPSEHILLQFGAGGQLISEELGHIFVTLSTDQDGHSEEDDGDHHHEHEHDHSGEQTIITPAAVLAAHGTNGILDKNGLIAACPMLLSCQLDRDCLLSSETKEMNGDDSDDEENSLLALKIIAAAVFFLEVMVGGMVPLIVGHFEKLGTWISLLNSFSGGIFMGAAFIHMLPEVQEAQESVEGLNGYPLGGVMTLVGFLIVFLIEHVICKTHNHGAPQSIGTPPETQNPIKAVNDLARETKRGPKTFSEVMTPVKGPIILMMAVSVHSLFEALALGLQTDQNGILLLFATIGSHKGVAAMALSARFVREEASKKQVLICLGVFATIAPLGILSGVWVSDVPDLVLLILNGLATGTFIYIGAYEVISDEFGHNRGVGANDKYIVHKYVAVVFGVFLMSMLQLIPHEHSH